MTQTTKIRSHKIACVIDEIALRQLGRILSEIDAPPCFTVSLEDGTKLEFDAVEKVIDMANSKTNPIVGIDARVRDKGQDKEIAVYLANPLMTGSPVYYSIAGSQQECILWSRQLDEWVSEAKAWYSRIANVDFVTFNFGLLVGLILALFVVAAIYILLGGVSTENGGDAKSEDSSPLNAILILAAVMAFLLGSILNVVRNRLFPVWTFAIGYGKKRYEGQKRLREFIGVAVIVSFLINVLAALVLGSI